MSFTKDQYNHPILMVLATNRHVALGSYCFSLANFVTSIPWLIGTDATDHICCNLNWFITHTRIAHFSGTVQLTHSLSH